MRKEDAEGVLLVFVLFYLRAISRVQSMITRSDRGHKHGSKVETLPGMQETGRLLHGARANEQMRCKENIGVGKSGKKITPNRDEENKPRNE